MSPLYRVGAIGKGIANTVHHSHATSAEETFAQITIEQFATCRPICC